MEDHLKEALDIVKAQAKVRELSEEQIMHMVEKLSKGIELLLSGKSVSQSAPVDPKKAIREKTIINLEDGKPYKVITKKNLARFGLTPDEYREKWGYKRGTPLICKALQRERREKMKSMELWKKRKKSIKQPSEGNK